MSSSGNAVQALSLVQFLLGRKAPGHSDRFAANATGSRPDRPGGGGYGVRWSRKGNLGCALNGRIKALFSVFSHHDCWHSIRVSQETRHLRRLSGLRWVVSSN